MASTFADTGGGGVAMPKPHRDAADGIDFETQLGVDAVVNIIHRAAAQSTGDAEHGRQRVVVGKVADHTVEVRINDYAVSFKKLLTFTMNLAPHGSTLFGSSAIDWYLTERARLAAGGGKRIVAHHTYLQFVRSIAAQLLSSDPRAPVTLRIAGSQGEDWTGTVHQPTEPQFHGAHSEPMFGLAGSTAGSVIAPMPAASASAPAPPTEFAMPEAPQGPLVTGVPRSLGGTGQPAGTRGTHDDAAVRAADGVDATPAAQMFAEDEDLEHTRGVQRTDPRGWSLRLPDGSGIRVETAVILGRAPVAPGALGSAAPLRISDPRRSVSKTHAVLSVRDGMLWVSDLHSTNGTVLTNPAGEGIQCEPGMELPVGDSWRISLGEFTMTARLEPR